MEQDGSMGPSRKDSEVDNRNSEMNLEESESTQVHHQMKRNQ